MRMTATDIRQQQFAVRLFRGFDPQEVDAFLEEMADDVDELSRENALLKEQLIAVEEKSRGVEGREKTLQETLVTTQKIAEEFKENARREAELVLREAHLRAEKFMQDAREEHAKLTSEISSLRRLRRQLAEEIMSTLATHKRLAEQALAEGDVAS
ncbi:MAG TPA: DivIVA domain-containing protein [Methylomirabilota bacterium]|nr:DivIVA domain-containing protein [Methylomirabilota bacterium]